MISKQTFQDDIIVCNMIREGDSLDCEASGNLQAYRFAIAYREAWQEVRTAEVPESSVGLNSVCGHSCAVGAESQVCLEGGSN